MEFYALKEAVDNLLKKLVTDEVSGIKKLDEKAALSFLKIGKELNSSSIIDAMALAVHKDQQLEARFIKLMEKLKAFQVQIDQGLVDLWHTINKLGEPQQMLHLLVERQRVAKAALVAAELELEKKKVEEAKTQQELEEYKRKLEEQEEANKKKAEKLAQIKAEKEQLLAKLAALDQEEKGL